MQQAAGQEHTSQGETRDVQQGQRSRGIYSASAYFWMYYAPAPQGHQLQRVAPGERAGPGQCHAVLDPAANVDADSVVGSNSTEAAVAVEVLDGCTCGAASSTVEVFFFLPFLG